MRTWLALVIGLLVGGAVVYGALRGWTTLAPGAAWAPRVPTAMAPGGQVREFRLEARPAKWEILPGIVTDAWTYNGQVPGPELRVREGDLVRVIVTNRLPVPTTIHWHGVDLNWKMDGVPGVTQLPIQPGATFTYEFVATPAGTRMYHTHQDTNLQLELGLYGALIIEPRAGPRYDVDRTIILDERALDLTPEVALGQREVRGADAGNGRGGLFQYDLFLMDGKAGDAIPRIAVKPDQRVLLRLINLGNLTHAMHLHGHTFKIVATDGNPVPPQGQWLKDTVQISPGERYDVEVIAYNPGVWMFHCHMPNHGDNGMMTLMQYEGFAPVTRGGHQFHFQAPVQAVPEPPAGPESAGPQEAAPPVPSASPPQPAGPGTAGRPARPAPVKPANSSIVTVPMLDNRFTPADLVVKRGTTVRWLNRGQNIHTTSSLEGSWDSPGLERRQSFSFTFTKPGEYRYLCRQHLLNGMIGVITVKP